jgi:error-prone DNA polymerase
MGFFELSDREYNSAAATATQERQRGSIRDVGRAMGLSVDTIKQISFSIREFTPEFLEGKRMAGQGLNPLDPLLRKTLQLTEQLMGFLWTFGMHTGGFVITEGKLFDLCPLLNARMENRTTIEWNKDDIDALGFLKIDAPSIYSDLRLFTGFVRAALMACTLIVSSVMQTTDAPVTRKTSTPIFVR